MGPAERSRQVLPGSRSAAVKRALNRRAARLRRVIDPDRRYAPAVRPLRSDALFCIHRSFLGCLLHAAPTPPTRRHDAVAMRGGIRAMTGAALLWAAAAADNATHTLVATVLNDKYAPLFELWHPRFAAATDATTELVVACLDDEAVAAVRRLDDARGRSRRPEGPTTSRRRGSPRS